MQSHRIAAPGDARLGDYDGMAELWFDDEATARAALATPETEATGRDARNFIMKGSIRRFFCSEEEIVP